MSKLAVFASGAGTNLRAIIESCQNGVLAANVVLVISNKEDAGALTIAKENNIEAVCFPFNKSDHSARSTHSVHSAHSTHSVDRSEYDTKLVNYLNKYNYDLIVLAGWMHVLSNSFLSKVKSPVINLHPALSGQFPGKSAINDAYNAYKLGLIKNTGIMVHNVVEQIDAGAVIEQMEIPINPTDTLSNLESRVKYYEKFVLIRAIDKTLKNKMVVKSPEKNKYNMIYKGKVRDVYDIGYNLLAMVQSDRQSAFDRYIL